MNNVLFQDFNKNIISYINNDFATLKKLSESSKQCNILVKHNTNFKEMIEYKINCYNCDMVESYLIKILKPEILRFKENKINQYNTILKIYIKKLNKKCIDILYKKIDYFYTERNIGLNNYIQELSYLLSKKLFDIMILIEDNLNIYDHNILEWFNIKYL
tara:strand:- start:1826 stop:2305 length:480 start_codon:yes stop_codon:yes gene_type:complete